MALTHDLRLACRHLRRSSGYATAATLTLAVAIGANAAIFSAVQAVLLRPLPVHDQDNVAVVWQTDSGGQAVVELTYRHLREWTASSPLFSDASVMASHNWSAVLQNRGEPARVWFNGVSGNFFNTLGARPLIGRALRPEDDVPNGPSVAVLNHDLWMRRFGADRDVVGTTMTLDGSPVEIVGVMPPGFDIPRGAEFWMPAQPIVASGPPANLTNLNTFGVFYVVGRLSPSLHASTLASAIDDVEARLDAADPGRLKWGARAVATPLSDYVFGPMRPALWALWGAVAVLLLIACANVSGLTLTRVVQRRQELGVRLALGATRSAVARLWLVEVACIALAGGILGLAAGAGLLRVLVALAPDDLPRLGEISIDPTVAAFTFAVVVVAALLSSIMPIRRAGDVGLTDSLGSSRVTAGGRVLSARAFLLTAQIAFAVVLLVAAGLIVRSFASLSRVELGFAPDRVLSATVQPRGAGVPPNSWLHEFLGRVGSLSGVEAAGAVYLRPLVLGPIGQGVRVWLEGQPETRQAADANPTLNHQIATPGYRDALHIPLRAGRWFTDQDTADVPRVAVVSESTARRLWPGQDPLGKRLLMASFTPGGPPRAWRTVVGVVSDVRYHDLGETRLDIYDAALQVGRPADNVLIRTAGDPLALAPALRSLARQMDAGVIVDNVTTMAAVVRRAQAPWRVSLWMFVLFAGLAFALAAVGLFTLVSLDVAQRGRELALRQALGASRGAMIRTVVRRAAVVVSVGVAGGIGLSLVATRALRSLLFDVAAADLTTYVRVLGLLVAVVAVAVYVPARRALRSRPGTLLNAP